MGLTCKDSYTHSSDLAVLPAGPDRELRTVRQTMIDFLQNHTEGSRPPACPPLNPIQPSDVLSLIDHRGSHYVAIVFESNSSYLGREVSCLRGLRVSLRGVTGGGGGLGADHCFSFSAPAPCWATAFLSTAEGLVVEGGNILAPGRAFVLGGLMVEGGNSFALGGLFHWGTWRWREGTALPLRGLLEVHLGRKLQTPAL
ncbi:hypothetical protein P7K49_002031 [Saguinus oedipus]|uniref:Sulfhydryl oxidase Trx-like domain-containing protein n=1 Tax=Saguinus oedipus TaxID=9490 RepID=A0ABQ9WGR7_SAGOE|nr:hypothetical protein P7K49_002031 [Saguinus oedipus]